MRHELIIEGNRGERPIVVGPTIEEIVIKLSTATGAAKLVTLPSMHGPMSIHAPSVRAVIPMS